MNQQPCRKSADLNTTVQTFLPHQQIPSGTQKATMVLILVFWCCTWSHIFLIAAIIVSRYEILKLMKTVHVPSKTQWSSVAASLTGVIKVVPPRTTLVAHHKPYLKNSTAHLNVCNLVWPLLDNGQTMAKQCSYGAVMGFKGWWTPALP